MSEQLLVRDVMRIGVSTCKPEDSVQAAAQQMLEQNCTALVVLDEEGDCRGWVSERCLAAVYARATQATDQDVAAAGLTVADIMVEDVPECPADVPLSA